MFNWSIGDYRLIYFTAIETINNAYQTYSAETRVLSNWFPTLQLNLTQNLGSFTIFRRWQRNDFRAINIQPQGMKAFHSRHNVRSKLVTKQCASAYIHLALPFIKITADFVAGCQPFIPSSLLYVPQNSTTRTCTFCLRSVVLCFVCMSKQIAPFALYNSNWFVFITKTQCLLRGPKWVF